MRRRDEWRKAFSEKLRTFQAAERIRTRDSIARPIERDAPPASSESASKECPAEMERTVDSERNRLVKKRAPFYRSGCIFSIAARPLSAPVKTPSTCEAV